MKVLELSGVVAANDPCKEDWYVENVEGPSINGKHVIEALAETFGSGSCDYVAFKDLTFMLAHGGDEDLYRGDGYAIEGDHGYSSLTPGSAPSLYIGGADLIARLLDLDGQTVMLRVDDGARHSLTTTDPGLPT